MGWMGKEPIAWQRLAGSGGLSRERMRQLRNNALVLLRLPALSMHLRSLCERDSRQAYQQALTLNRTWQRSQRRRR